MRILILVKNFIITKIKKKRGDFFRKDEEISLAIIKWNCLMHLEIKLLSTKPYIFLLGLASS